MAIDPGTSDATSGLSKALFVAMDATLRPPLVAQLQAVKPPMSQADIDKAVADAQAKWKPLAYATAAGMVAVLRKEPPTSPPIPDPVFAETFSSNAQDSTFWTWMASFAKVFQTWAPTGAATDGQLLKTALTAFFNSNPVPTELKGILR